MAKQIAAENTLVINQLKLICGMPKKEGSKERGEEEEGEKQKQSRDRD